MIETQQNSKVWDVQADFFSLPIFSSAITIAYFLNL